MTAAADRHLLFGLLALQNGIINQGQLVAAFQAWTLDKSRSLADHLEARGDLTVAKRALLEALAEVHLEAHGGDVEQEPGRGLGRQIDAARAWRGSATRTSRRPSATSARARLDRRRRRRPHRHLFRRLGHLRRPAVPRPAAPRPRRPGRRLRGARRRAEPRGGAQADPRPARRRPRPAASGSCVEAEITGGLEHPGIVPVYGLGTYDDGRPYYAMRFIRGDSLKEAIERLPRRRGAEGRPRRAGRWSCASCCGGSPTSATPSTTPTRRGVLHRDIKPGNVIVGKHGETLVVDWGLAKPLGKAERGRPSAASGR